MIAFSGMTLRTAIMDPGRRARVIMAPRRSIPRPYHFVQAIINLFIDWLLGISLTFGHYGPAILGCASQVIYIA